MSALSLSKDDPLYQIRPIIEGDNASIAKVIRTVLEEYGVARPGTVYTDSATDELFYFFQEENAAYWIAELNGEIVGGCGIFPTEGLPTGCVELVKLYVLKHARGRGIGAELMNMSIAYAKHQGFEQIYLETMPELDDAIGLYERIGFRLIDHRLGNTGHHACKIWMVMDL